MTDAISGNYTQLPPPAPVHKTVLGQSDFLALMAAQLKNQDPTKPVENNEMIGQMAQFSQLTAQTAGNTSLDAIAAKLDTLIAATLSAKD